MKKKFLSVMLASVMAMSMIGCGSSAVSGVAEQAPEQTQSTDSAQPADTAAIPRDTCNCRRTRRLTSEPSNVLLR